MKDVQSKWLVFLWFIINNISCGTCINEKKQSSEIRIKDKHPTVESIAIETVGANTN